jgi:hypothetical protein
MSDSDKKETGNEGFVSGSGDEIIQFLQSITAEMRHFQNGARQANLLCGQMRVALSKAANQIHELDKSMEDLDSMTTVLREKMERFGLVDPSRGLSDFNPVWLMNIEARRVTTARKLVMATLSSPSSKLLGHMSIFCFVLIVLSVHTGPGGNEILLVDETVREELEGEERVIIPETGRECSGSALDSSESFVFEFV